MGNGSKIVKYVDPVDLPGFFRSLADALEKGGSDEFACVDDFKKFKISASREYGQVHVKAKFKTESECRAPEDLIDREELPSGERPEFSVLKKRMRTSFKAMVTMIHEGRVPPREAVDAFLSDSALMVTYPGYGDEFYDSYREVCDSFRAAYEAGDVTAMHRGIDALIHEKSRCHAKYD